MLHYRNRFSANRRSSPKDNKKPRQQESYQAVKISHAAPNTAISSQSPIPAVVIFSTFANGPKWTF
jgi:hypothetical protein